MYVYVFGHAWCTRHRENSLINITKNNKLLYLLNILLNKQ